MLVVRRHTSCESWGYYFLPDIIDRKIRVGEKYKLDSNS
jgi:hypothetical protein